MKEDKF